MRQSVLFTRTKRQPPTGETSMNAQLLEQGGFVAKLMAGVYSYLPLGFRVLGKINQIIREEMNAIGGQEVFFPALQPKDVWDKTGRWKDLKDIMYQFEDHSGKPVGLAITHEEVVAETVRQHVTSYKDLPFSLYQIQTKFRHELRPKSGLNRGREFMMKDLYSCHVDDADCQRYYEIVKVAYAKTFQRLGLDAKIVEASGGDFSNEFSHEFQVFTDAGEDYVYFCESCDFAQNKEIAKIKEGDACPSCSNGRIAVRKAIEVGNIFRLGTRFSEALDATFVDSDGQKKPIVMASYGIGPSRVMGTIVEVHHDDNGIVWPEAVSPFAVHLLALGKDPATRQRATKLYDELTAKGIEVLFDDREVSPGEKFKDSDLIGIPHRLVVSDRTGEQIEYRRRGQGEAETLSLAEIIHRIGI